MNRFSKYLTSTFIFIIIYLAFTAYLVSTFPSFWQHPTYPLDDTYIYMAMARNIVEHGIWGVTKYGFSGTSSAHLWVIILSSVFRIFGVAEIAPFILNLVFGT